MIRQKHLFRREYPLLTHFSHSAQFQRWCHQRNNILLVQFGTVRDIIRTLPIVNILRLRFPHAKIAWLASPEMIDFLNSYNIADRLIVAKPSWYKKFCEIKTLRKKLQSFAPDLCLDLQGDLSSAFAAKLSGSGQCLSVNGTKRRLFGRSKKTESLEHPLEKRLKLLETLDIAGASIDYNLPEIPLERREVGWVMRDLGLDSTPFAMFSIGVQSNSSHVATSAITWEIDRYVQVAEHLWHTHHLPVAAVWRTAQEKRIAEKIVAEAGGMVALAPILSAIQLAALARRTSVFVGVATSAMTPHSDFLHIAAAVGAPCIGVFCDENARRDAPCCDNFQAIMVQAGGSRWNGRAGGANGCTGGTKRRGHPPGASPVRIDNYTYDVIEVCHACDGILQPVMPPAQQPVAPEVQPEFPVGIPTFPVGEPTVPPAQQQTQLVEV